MTLPDQHPPRRRPVPLRPRNDPYRLATFRAPMTPRVVLPPTEAFDPDGEAREFEWPELRQPWWFWLAAVGTVLGGVLVLAFFLTGA